MPGIVMLHSPCNFFRLLVGSALLTSFIFCSRSEWLMMNTLQMLLCCHLCHFAATFQMMCVRVQQELMHCCTLCQCKPSLPLRIPAGKLSSWQLCNKSYTSVMPLLRRHLCHAAVGFLQVHIPPVAIPAVCPGNAAHGTIMINTLKKGRSRNATSRWQGKVQWIVSVLS